MVSTYVGDSISRSITPADNLRDTLAVYSVMERIRLQDDNSETMTLAELKTDIGTTASNPQNNPFGTYNVVSNNYVQCDDPTLTTPTFISCTPPAAPPCLLMVTVSDPSQPGIKVSTLFTE